MSSNFHSATRRISRRVIKELWGLDASLAGCDGHAISLSRRIQLLVGRHYVSGIPEPLNWDSAFKESFPEYWLRWPAKYSHVPEVVVETWIHRHWAQFRGWRALRPELWTYEIRRLASSQVLTIGDVTDPANDSDDWGNDLIDGLKKGECWLRDYMLEHGTTPAPIVVAENAGHIPHPHHDGRMTEPFQLIEGHRRFALLKAMIRRNQPNLHSHHEVAFARIPDLELP